MGSHDIELNSLELRFPIKFLKNAIAESTSSAAKRWTLLRQVESESHMDASAFPDSNIITTQKVQQDSTEERSPGSIQSVNTLLIKINRTVLQYECGKHSCSFVEILDENTSDIDEAGLLSENIVTKSAGTQTEYARDIKSEPKDIKKVLGKTPDNTNIGETKRKRGRPRKSEVTTIKKSSEKESKKENDSLGDNSVGRYSLRGVKLSSAIILAEKGIYTTAKSLTDKQETKTKEGEDIQSDEVDCNGNETENVGFSVYSDETEYDIDFEMIKRKRGRKRKGSKVAIIRTRKNQKIDLGDVPRLERRKRNVEKTASCKFCNKMLCDYTGVEEHVRKFHMNEPDIDKYFEELKQRKITICEICNISFPSRHHLQSHQDKEHRPNVAVLCNRCGITCKNIVSLRNHVKAVHILHGVKAYLCHLCPAKFKWPATLKQHLEEIHEGKKHFQCKICQKSFYRHAQLKRHERIHGLDESKRLYCSVCGKSFLFQCNLDRHMKSLHEPQVESFHCSYCGKGFNRKVGMISHVRLVHFNLFPFSCPECKLKFPRSKMLKDHMSTVHSKHNFEVSDSRNERFKYNKSSDDLFYCSYCTESFHYKAKLVEHIHVTHSDAFPCVCTVCSQGFLEKSFLLKHRKKAHGITDENIDSKELTRTDSSSKQVLHVIPGSAGSTGKVVCVQKEGHRKTSDVSDIVEPAEQDSAIESFDNTSDSNAASLLVEVARGSNTYTYYIQAPPTQEGGGATNVEDIANLLLAAEQSIIQSDESSDSRQEVEYTTEELTVVEQTPNSTEEAAIECSTENVTVVEGAGETFDLASVEIVESGNLNQEIIVDYSVEADSQETV